MTVEQAAKEADAMSEGFSGVTWPAVGESRNLPQHRHALCGYFGAKF
jgi:hypothetical protein